MGLSTDYLVVGAGLQGLTFASEIVSHSDATLTLVDRRPQPGGHWNEAYPFVRLHQPSVYYGVGAVPLGGDKIERDGINAGLFEQATGQEVLVHLQRALHDHLLPSGRVRFLPKHEYEARADGTHHIRSLLSGHEEKIDVRKRLVDTTALGVQTPESHTPNFDVAPGTPFCTPMALTEVQNAPSHICILGGGKTSMDVVVWLRQFAYPAQKISWVRPRDSWLINRETAQPGNSGLVRMTENYANKLRAAAAASTIDELYLALETTEDFFRIDPSYWPKMNHGATISRGELNVLREIRNVLRHGRVEQISPGQIEFAHVQQKLPEDTLFVDCTAPAFSYDPARPVFSPGRITLQIIREGLVSLSAAAIGYIEATFEDEDHVKNALAMPIEYNEAQTSWPRAFLRELQTQAAWADHKPLRNWARNHRLTGFGEAETEAAATRLATLSEEIKTLRQPATDSLTRLIAG